MPEAQATRRDLLLALRRPSGTGLGPKDPGIRAVAAIGPSCLNYVGTICEACRDVCPTRAIRAVPRLRQAPIVAVREQDCTGCGDCLPACPVAAIALQVVAHG